MRPTRLSSYMSDLLNRQTGMIARAIADLNSVRNDLPPHRQAEVDAIIQTLQNAANEDREALAFMAKGVKASSDSG